MRLDLALSCDRKALRVAGVGAGGQSHVQSDGLGLCDLLDWHGMGNPGRTWLVCSFKGLSKDTFDKYNEQLTAPKAFQHGLELFMRLLDLVGGVRGTRLVGSLRRLACRDCVDS